MREQEMGPRGSGSPPSVGSRVPEKAHPAPGGWAPPAGFLKVWVVRWSLNV